MRDTVLKIVERSTAARLPEKVSWLRSLWLSPRQAATKELAVSVSGPRALSKPSERLDCWLIKGRVVRRKRQKNKENWSIAADNAQLLVLRA